MKPYTLIIFSLTLFLLLPYRGVSQKDKAVLKFLDQTNSFTYHRDSFEKSNPWYLANFDITPYSFIRDSIDYFRYDCIDYSSDPFIEQMLNMKAGEIAYEKTDSLEAYYKCIEADSLLHLNVSCTPYSSNSRLSIDTFYNRISHKLKSGKSWEEINRVCQGPFGMPYYDNTHGWQRAGELEEGFVKCIASHQKGDLFIYKSDLYQVVWIIYKRDEERYFKSRKLIMVRK